MGGGRVGKRRQFGVEIPVVNLDLDERINEVTRPVQNEEAAMDLLLGGEG